MTEFSVGDPYLDRVTPTQTLSFNTENLMPTVSTAMLQSSEQDYNVYVTRGLK